MKLELKILEQHLVLLENMVKLFCLLHQVVVRHVLLVTTANQDKLNLYCVQLELSALAALTPLLQLLDSDTVLLALYALLVLNVPHLVQLQQLLVELDIFHLLVQQHALDVTQVIFATQLLTRKLTWNRIFVVEFSA